MPRWESLSAVNASKWERFSQNHKPDGWRGTWRCESKCSCVHTSPQCGDPDLKCFRGLETVLMHRHEGNGPNWGGSTVLDNKHSFPDRAKCFVLPQILQALIAHYFKYLRVWKADLHSQLKTQWCWPRTTATWFLFLSFFHANIQIRTLLPPRLQMYQENYCHPENCTQHFPCCSKKMGARQEEVGQHMVSH